MEYKYLFLHEYHYGLLYEYYSIFLVQKSKNIINQTMVYQQTPLQSPFHCIGGTSFSNDLLSL